MARFKLGKKAKRDQSSTSSSTMPSVMTEEYPPGRGNGRSSIGQAPHGFNPASHHDQGSVAGSVGGGPSVISDLHPSNAKFGHTQSRSISSVHGKPLPAGVTTPWKRFKLANSPFPRYRHAASSVTSDKNEVFLMGGLKEGSVFGDTWKIVPRTTRHEIIGYESSPVEVASVQTPPARVGHASVLCGNAFIVYGGDTVDTDENGFPDNNFYLFNINNSKYTVPSHILNKPNGRYGHTLAVVSLTNSSSRLYLFGGQLENQVYDDLYYFELNTFKSPKAKWDVVEPQNNFKPPPLTNHSMSVYKNKLYIFGGVYNNEKVSNDLWCYDPAQNKWMQVPTTGQCPPPTNEHSACVVGDRLFVYGGNDFSGIIYSSMYVLDLTNFSWQKVNAAGEVAGPGPRCGHSMTFVPRYHKLVVLGGDKNDYVRDDPNDFDVYDNYSGEQGTMLFELDVDYIDHFLGGDGGASHVAQHVASPRQAQTGVAGHPVASPQQLLSPQQGASSPREPIREPARDISQDIIPPQSPGNEFSGGADGAGGVAAGMGAGAVGAGVLGAGALGVGAGALGASAITDHHEAKEVHSPAHPPQSYASHGRSYSNGPEDFASAEASPMVKPVPATNNVPPIPTIEDKFVDPPVPSSIDSSPVIQKKEFRKSLDPGKTNVPEIEDDHGVAPLAIGGAAAGAAGAAGAATADYGVPSINGSSVTSGAPHHQSEVHPEVPSEFKSPTFTRGIHEESTPPLKVPDAPHEDDDPLANQNNALSRSMTNDGGKLKALVAELSAQLNHLRTNTKVQMQQASERITALEHENRELREMEPSRVPAPVDNDSDQLRAQLAEQNDLIAELKSQINAESLDVNSKDLSQPGKRSSVSDVGKFKLERMELKQRITQLEGHNSQMKTQLDEFEPFMNNQIGEISQFQQVIDQQERQLSSLGAQVLDQNKLQAELDEWKTKYANLDREFTTYKQVYGEPEPQVNGSRELGDEANANHRQRSLASHMQGLVSIWTTRSEEIKEKSLNAPPAADPEQVTMLQKQLDDLMEVSKQNDDDAAREISDLRALIEEKSSSNHALEAKYRDALSSVNNTSKALKLNQEEVQSQKHTLEKLMKENNELKLFKKANKRVSSRSATPSGNATGLHAADGAPSVPPIVEDSDDEDGTLTAHANMKIKDLEADLYIMGQERDSLKDQVTSLKKELYMAKS